jgi:hypothetical protein
MPIVPCKQCSAEFYVKPSHQQRGAGKYCSRLCQSESQRTGTFIPCYICHKLAYKMAAAIQKSPSGKFFCGKSCQTIWRNTQVYTGRNHANWTNGIASYRQRLLRSETAKLCLKCRIDDVRILAVHHKDRDRTNNDLSNLIWLCHNCHYLVHHYKREGLHFVTQ